MKKKVIFLVSTIILFIACKQKSPISIIKVANIEELNLAIKNCKQGDHITLKDGVWSNVEIKFIGSGSKENPIVLQAETPGKVFIEGTSNLQIAGEYLHVKDLYFRNGYTPDNSVIRFKIDNRLIANYCKVTNCVIQEFTQKDREITDHWIEFWGRHNELSNCYIAGKSNFGPTVMVNLQGNEHIKNYHQIINNYFGPRPRKGGPHGETIQLGSSHTSVTPSHTEVSNNFFEHCNGEVEIISNKSNYNQFRNNVFFECEGSLVLRHGNYVTVDGNIFIGNDKSEFIGGIRVINSGHWITNNYFYKLNGKEFRAPLAIMNGIPKSPQNRYNQVTDVVIAYNSFINCKTPFHIGVGANLNQSEVLPPSEIRSARPVRTVLANNLLFNDDTDIDFVKIYDEADGIEFQNNYSNCENYGDFIPDGLISKNFELKSISKYIFAPNENITDVYQGFDFDNITTDILGTPRAPKSNSVGAIINSNTSYKDKIDKSKYGTNWFLSNDSSIKNKTIVVASEIELIEKFQSANSGDTLLLKSGVYNIEEELVVDKSITLSVENKQSSVELIFGKPKTAFLLKPKSSLKVENIKIKGNKQQTTFSTLDKNMSKAYNLFLEAVEIDNFKSVLEVSKGSFADTISISNSIIKNCINGINLRKEVDAKGDYNAEFVLIRNSKINNIDQNVLNYFRGGYDESSIGGNLMIKDNVFSNCGKTDTNNILIENHGIVNVDISDNTFVNNPLKIIAVLWGEKGQRPVNNKIINSGKFDIVQNLKLKLMY